MELHTPAASSTDHTTATATTVTMPMATASRNAVFSTDHGSTWVTRNLALRTRRGVSQGRGVAGVACPDLLPAIAAANRSAPVGFAGAAAGPPAVLPDAVGRPAVLLDAAGRPAGASSGSTGPDDAYAALIRS